MKKNNVGQIEKKMLINVRHCEIIEVGENPPERKVIEMKVEITREDYNDIMMAIAVAKASCIGTAFQMGYDDLRDRFMTAWENAEEENLIERIERAVRSKA